MKVKLTAEEHSEYGEIGWLLNKIECDHSLFGPSSFPPGIAHDILEHNSFESVADEIEAHGAMYWVRFQSGYISLDNIANEWISLVYGLSFEAFMPDVPKTRPLDTTIESDIDAIMDLGIRHCKAEFKYEEKEDRYQDELEKIIAAFRSHFRIGYRRATRKYKGFSPLDVALTFDAIKDKFEHFQPEFEGQEILVNINLQDRTCQVTETYVD